MSSLRKIRKEHLQSRYLHSSQDPTQKHKPIYCFLKQPTTSNTQAPKILPRQRHIFAIKWTCGILTVAASVVFGIWAPLSYEATFSDNDMDNAIISVLSNVKDLASTANIIASNALDTASAQQELLGSLYGTIGLMGQLAVMDFCYAQQEGWESESISGGEGRETENESSRCRNAWL